MVTALEVNVNNETQQAEMQRVFNLQVANELKVGQTNARERIKKLDKLYDAVIRHKQDIRDALYKDYRKPQAEADLTEVFVITSEIKHARRHLRSWMRLKRVSTPLSLVGSRSWIQYESKGTSLIIAPWNYPIQLTFGPLVSAIAAGNPVIIKPSEHTPHSAALMTKMLGEIYDESEVAIFEGGIQTSTDLLSLPFKHIFFTGAPSIGKVVMQAAAKNLTSVTLELGGKSPTIIDETADLKTTAARLAWGKFSNNGQICIAPDYVFVHEKVKDKLLELVKEQVNAMYGENPAESGDYMRVVNSRHFKRVKSYLDDSVAKGAKIEIGGTSDATQDFLAPTVVTNVSMDSALMENEIFGPVLPIFTYTDLDEVLKEINSRDKPLALYIYSKRKKTIDYILKNTRAGGTCINNNALHFFNNNLPFGGSNNSGIGKSHGEFGFKAFSNERGVYKQVLPSALDLLTPPYNDTKQKLIDLTLKWF